MLRIVKTENGQVEGIPAADPRITAFKGIPFAAASGWTEQVARTRSRAKTGRVFVRHIHLHPYQFRTRRVSEIIFITGNGM